MVGLSPTIQPFGLPSTIALERAASPVASSSLVMPSAANPAGVSSTLE